MSDPTIYDVLKTEHRLVSELMEQAEALPEGDPKRNQLLDQIKEELLSHAKAEEAEVYPVLMPHEEFRPLALEAVEEHRVVARLLTELDRMRTTNERFTAKLTVLKENVEHHVKEEENELFAALKKVLERDEAKQLAVTFQQTKERLRRELAAA